MITGGKVRSTISALSDCDTVGGEYPVYLGATESMSWRACSIFFVEEFSHIMFLKEGVNLPFLVIKIIVKIADY